MTSPAAKSGGKAIKKISPRVAWVERQVRERYDGLCVLDAGFVGAYEEPFLHLTMRAENSRTQLFGVDVNVDAIARQTLPNTIGGNAESLGFKDGCFDAVLCLEVLEHLYCPMRVLSEFWRVLRPDGELVITTPNAWSWSNFLRHWLAGSMTSRCERRVYRSYLGDADHKHFYDPLSLINVIHDAGFETIALTTKNHAVPGLRRWLKSCDLLDWQFYPMDRLGHYLCLVARKSAAPRQVHS
jgi:SAM-dependent methyltransferase